MVNFIGRLQGHLKKSKNENVTGTTERMSLPDELRIKDFVKIADIPESVITKYKDQVNDEVLFIWREYGEGSFYDGYFRIINPCDYEDLIKDTYFVGDISIPVMVTAFGDIITWEENKYLGIIYYKDHDFKIMSKGIKKFLTFLEEEEFRKDFFDIKLYEKARTKLGQINHDECYCFVPILPLGGKKTVNNLEIGKTREHIEVITQLVGGVGMS